MQYVLDRKLVACITSSHAVLTGYARGMSVVADDPRPPKVQVADSLREDITAGRLEPGAKLDSVRALSERFGVASQTMTNALKILIDEGLIHSVPNRGYFVQEPGTKRAPSPEYTALAQQLDAVTEAVRELTDRVAQLEGAMQRGRK